jgi:hypothetical protein
MAREWVVEWKKICQESCRVLRAKKKHKRLCFRGAAQGKEVRYCELEEVRKI